MVPVLAACVILASLLLSLLLWFVVRSTLIDREKWRDKTPETAVIITNYARHFGEKDAAAPSNLFAIMPSPNPGNPLADPDVIDDLFFCPSHYGAVQIKSDKIATFGTHVLVDSLLRHRLS